MRRHLQELGGIDANRFGGRNPGNDRRRPIERPNPAVRIGADETAQQTVDHVLVERAEVLDLMRGILEFRARGFETLGQRLRQPRHGEEPEQIDEDGVLREAERRQIDGGRHPEQEHWAGNRAAHTASSRARGRGPR